MRQIWGEIDENWFKEILNVEFLQLDYRSGKILISIKNFKVTLMKDIGGNIVIENSLIFG